VSNYYTAPLLIIFGFFPSLVWLFYYLRKDCHPEPKSMIARTLFIGILTAPLAIAAELIFIKVFEFSFPKLIIANSVLFFLWAAFAEEYVKYLAVRFGVINNPNFDEPVDAMIYMISAGLGFAAIENILVIFQAFHSGEEIGTSVQAAFQIWSLRFAGATLLHAVSSALLGYFLALSWFYTHHSKKIMAMGFLLATLAHFVFNISLLATGADIFGFILSSVGLFAMIILIGFLFKRLKTRMAEPKVDNISSAFNS
jgi:RsiW-degrading membrane proteinase PrsW (M82 family)